MGSPAPFPPCLSWAPTSHSHVMGSCVPFSTYLRGVRLAIYCPLSPSSCSPCSPQRIFPSSVSTFSPVTFTPSRLEHLSTVCTLPNLTQQNHGQKEKDHNAPIHLLPGALSSKLTVELTEDACLSVMCILGLWVHQSQLLCAGCLLKTAGTSCQKANSDVET